MKIIESFLYEIVFRLMMAQNNVKSEAGHMKAKILYDNDIGVDCDDAGAMAVMHELSALGECDILAVTHCCSGPFNAGCIDSINRYFGRPDIPVGVFHAEDRVQTKWQDIYAHVIAQRFTHSFPDEHLCPDTVSVMREILARAENNDVILVATGSLYSLRRLLESPPDMYSSLCGRELICSKIKKTVIMGGRFHQQWPDPVVLDDGYVVDAEFNIACDISSAQKVCNEWPGELVFCSYEIGYSLHTGARLQTEGLEGNPVHVSYEVYGAKNNIIGRESWDLATMLYAVRPDAGYWKLHEYGRVEVDDHGVTVWMPDSSAHHTFLLENKTTDEIRTVLDGFLDADLIRHQRK